MSREGSISLSISIREPKPGRMRANLPESISLSISIREPKLKPCNSCQEFCISLSISIREPKPHRAGQYAGKCISLSISIREPKQIAFRCELIRSISLSISIREPKPLDIVSKTVLALLHLLDYTSSKSLVSRKRSSSICLPQSSFIWLYCFSVTIIARTDPVGGRLSCTIRRCLCASS